MAKAEKKTAADKSAMDALAAMNKPGKKDAHDAGWFYAVWNKLAREGQVDEFDSAECVRVLEEWDRAARPREERFLIERANAVPGTRQFDGALS